MREALAALTVRGRGFLAAGASTLLCAVLLGQEDLLRVGALLVALPLLAATLVGRSRYRLGLVRSVTPTQVEAGQPARVRLDVTNDGRIPTGLLLLQDAVPAGLGGSPRFVVDRMGPRWKRSIDYPVCSPVRGAFALGPLRVRLTDPFGLVALDRGFSGTTSLVVTPPVVALPPVPLTGAWTGSGDNRPRAFATGSAEDVTVREYRHGDDLRRVHWRSSARAGELMVRREEQPWQSRATLFLDMRRLAHRGRGASSSLEHAVSVAASVAVHLVQRGFTVRLVTTGGEHGTATWHEHGAASAETGPLLEALAVAVESDAPTVDTRWLHDGDRSGLLVAVLGELTERDRAALSRMRHSTPNAVAVVLDVPSWSGGGSRASANAGTAWLVAQGWKAVTAGPGDAIGSVWQSLGRGRRTTSHVAGTASPAGQQWSTEGPAA